MVSLKSKSNPHTRHQNSVMQENKEIIHLSLNSKIHLNLRDEGIGVFLNDR
jgi:hypothetical protein